MGELLGIAQVAQLLDKKLVQFLADTPALRASGMPKVLITAMAAEHLT